MLPPRHACSGFTLVELLASLALLSLMSLMLLQALAGRGGDRIRLSRAAANGETVEAVQMVLSDRLQHAWPATRYTVAPPGPEFEGHADVVEFLAPPPATRGAGPLVRYQLALETGGDLVLRSRSELALDPKTWATRQVLLPGVQSLDVAYFGQANTERAPAWRADWVRQGTMPALVRVRLGFGDGDRRRWPELVVHPLADIDTECVLGGVSVLGCENR